MTAPRQPVHSQPAPQSSHSRLASWLVAIAILIVVYILSAGPILAAGCWLRDATS